MPCTDILIYGFYFAINMWTHFLGRDEKKNKNVMMEGSRPRLANILVAPLKSWVNENPSPG